MHDTLSSSFVGCGSVVVVSLYDDDWMMVPPPPPTTTTTTTRREERNGGGGGEDLRRALLESRTADETERDVNLRMLMHLRARRPEFEETAEAFLREAREGDGEMTFCNEEEARCEKRKDCRIDASA